MAWVQDTPRGYRRGSTGNPTARGGERLCGGEPRADQHDPRRWAARALRAARRPRRALRAVRGDGHGRLVLVGGEAGIGKTALVRAFCEEQRSLRLLWGACDALYTPRPLGPLARHARRRPAASSRRSSRRAPRPPSLVAALAGELRPARSERRGAGGSALGRRGDARRREPARPPHRGGAGAGAGDLSRRRARPRASAADRARRAPARAADRIALAPLSAEAVAALAGAARTSTPASCIARTGGNPFFVTEVLARRATPIPGHRARRRAGARARLDAGARALLDAVAVVPPRVELWLLEALAGRRSGGARRVPRLRRCCAPSATPSGSATRSRGSRSRRRSRRTGGVALHRTRARGARGHRARPDPARLAHHAEAAGDGAAVLRHAPAAGERAAALGVAPRGGGAVRPRAALRRRPGARAARRAARAPLVRVLPDRADRRARSRRAARALDVHRAARRPRCARATPPLALAPGLVRRRPRAADEEARRAVELLEPLAPGRELAMAYSNLAQLRMLARRPAGATSWGERAIELAERLGETEILVHALNNVGTAELQAGGDGGRREARAQPRAGARRRPRGARRPRVHQPRRRRVERARLRDAATAISTPGSPTAREHDLDAWLAYMTGWRARSQLDQGRWDDAADSATLVLGRPDVARRRAGSRRSPSRARCARAAATRTPGRRSTRRSSSARGTGELQRLAPVAGARAEARWLGGRPARSAARPTRRSRSALEQRDALGAGRAVRSGAGGPASSTSIELDAVAEPYRLELAGETRRPPRAWDALGCPYEAALALATPGREAPQRRGLAELQRLGAGRRRGASRARCASAACATSRAGPRAATRENPAGHDRARARGARARRRGPAQRRDRRSACSSRRRPSRHHVSAILRKLDVAHARPGGRRGGAPRASSKDRQSCRCAGRRAAA